MATKRLCMIYVFSRASVCESMSRPRQVNKNMLLALEKLHARARGILPYARVWVCVCVYMDTRANSLRAINNANGFRQRCRGIMHKHDCVNKMQKNCSIPRLRIAYHPWPSKTPRWCFNNVYIYPGIGQVCPLCVVVDENRTTRRG